MNAFVHLTIGRCAPSQAWEMCPSFLWDDNGIQPFSFILFAGHGSDQVEFEDQKNHHPFQRSNLQASYGFLELVFGVEEDRFFHDYLKGILAYFWCNNRVLKLIRSNKKFRIIITKFRDQILPPSSILQLVSYVQEERFFHNPMRGILAYLLFNNRVCNFIISFTRIKITELWFLLQFMHPF